MSKDPFQNYEYVLKRAKSVLNSIYVPHTLSPLSRESHLFSLCLSLTDEYLERGLHPWRVVRCILIQAKIRVFNVYSSTILYAIGGASTYSR